MDEQKRKPDEKSTSLEQDRRAFLRSAVYGGAFLGSCFKDFDAWASQPRFQRELMPEAEPLGQPKVSQDHNFIFIELKGGVMWSLATDARPLAQLPRRGNGYDLRKVFPINLEQGFNLSGPPNAANNEILNSFDARANHGEFCLLPYYDSPQSSYIVGRTNAGCRFRIGPCGHALRGHVNDIAVVRGVHIYGGFHGSANNEIFSGNSDGAQHHVAGVLAKQLESKFGMRLLDNVVFEQAAYTVGQTGSAKELVRIDGQSLGFLLASIGQDRLETMSLEFQRARQLSDAVAKASALGVTHQKVFSSYINAMNNAPSLIHQLVQLRETILNEDISLDLEKQCDTALTLIESGLTRVATLGVGANNGRNNVDVNGWFDAHSGLFFGSPDSDQANTARHYRNVESVMSALSYLIRQLKRKGLWQSTTVVVSSEFSRPLNLFGDESFGRAPFGNGHYLMNNNYILFGKNIRGGAWVGENDVMRLTGHLVDTEQIEREADPSAIRTSPVTFSKIRPTNVPKNNIGKVRALKAADVVKTLMAAGGVEAEYRNYYQGARVDDAKVIRSILA